MNGAPLVTVARLKIVGANFITVASEIVDCWSRFNGIRPNPTNHWIASITQPNFKRLPFSHAECNLKANLK